MPKSLLHLCFTLLALTLMAGSFSAQTKSPAEKPRKISPEPNRIYRDWPKTDVALIITDDERRAYEKLQTDDEREQFILQFWRLRDPDPDTEENEYKDDYYERTAYADEHFSSGTPGRLTDRGRIYIKFGKPDEIESHPSGGSYERTPYEGGGSTTTFPFERWFYRYLPNVGSGVDIEFVDPTGSGEYRIARNPLEKEATLFVPGTNPTLAQLLGLESQASRMIAAGSIGVINYQREQDSPFEVLERLRRLESTPGIPANNLGAGLSDTPKIDDNPLNFEVRADFFRQSDNRVLTAFTIQTDNRDLVFIDSGGLQAARLNIFGKIYNVAQRSVGAFEDSIVTTVTPTELIEAKERKSAYGKAVTLPPGHYRLDVMLRDVESGATGIRHYGFEVPHYNAGELSISSIVLAAKLESMRGKVAGGPFVIGQTKVIPNLTGEYKRGQPVGVYLQIYNAVINQTTLQPAVDVVYELLKNEEVIETHSEDWRGAADAGSRLTLTRLIGTEKLAPGEYRIVIRIRDHVTTQKLAAFAKFKIVP